MNLFSCPKCRQPFAFLQVCPDCDLTTDAAAHTYVEKLLETVLSKETSRAGMAVDVLTKWLHEPRSVVPLKILLQRKGDPYPQVLAARGLGWLKATSAVSALANLLLDEEQPFVSRVAAAEALGRIGEAASLRALEQGRQSQRPSVAEACIQALEKLQEAEQDLKL